MSANAYSEHRPQADVVVKPAFTLNLALNHHLNAYHCRTLAPYQTVAINEYSVIVIQYR